MGRLSIGSSEMGYFPKPTCVRMYVCAWQLLSLLVVNSISKTLFSDRASFSQVLLISISLPAQDTTVHDYSMIGCLDLVFCQQLTRSELSLSMQLFKPLQHQLAVFCESDSASLFCMYVHTYVLLISSP